MPRILAIDPGLRNWGLALSDAEGRLVARTWSFRGSAEELARAIGALSPDEVVIGWAEGSVTTRAARRLAGLLQKAGLRVRFADEAFTTALARKLLEEERGRKRGRGRRRPALRSKEPVNAKSAGILLDFYLRSKGAQGR